MMKKLLLFAVNIFSCSFAFAQEELKDIKPPLELPAGFWGWIVLGVVLLGGILSAGIFYWLRARNKQTQQQEPVKPCWQTAMEKINALLEKGYLSQGQLKEFYDELSDIVRFYIEDRFALRAPEMTTPEFLDHIKRRATQLTQEQKQTLREFLNACDMVKFAKYGPGPEEIDKSVEVAKNFIRETTGEA